MDKLFQIQTLRATPNPQQLVWLAAHQDYCADYIIERLDKVPSERDSGDFIIKHLLAGGRGHWGPFEHPQISLACGYFPHSVVQQLRTHRVGVSFDVQCLAAETVITFVNCEGETAPKLRKTIGELYDLWTNGELATRERKIKGRKNQPLGQYRRDCKKRLRKMRIRVLNEETGEFTTSHIKDVIESGVHPLYRVTLEDGKTLDCTANHRLLTTSGWQTMGEATGLIVNNDNSVASLTKTCSVMCNGKMVGEGIYRQQEWLEQQLQQGLHADEMAALAGCSVESIKEWVYYYGLKLNKRPSGTKHPWNKNKGGYQLNLTAEQREQRVLKAEQSTRRGEDSHFWRGGVSSDRVLNAAWTRQVASQIHARYKYICQRCGCKGGKLHAHHLVPYFANPSLGYSLENLITLCKDCHEYIHHNKIEKEFAETFIPITEEWKRPKAGKKRLVAHSARVVDVEYLGIQTTFDLEVEDPWHNFVANGLVVHNSFRYTSEQILQVVSGDTKDMESAFYLRPVGEYHDDAGNKYFYDETMRYNDSLHCFIQAELYAHRIGTKNYSKEHARDLLPFNYRQHFVLSCNARSLCHILDLRSKKDAQLECQWFCELLFERFEEWMPNVAAWYRSNRWGRARLAP